MTQDNILDRQECSACGPSTRSPGKIIGIHLENMIPVCDICCQPVDPGPAWPKILEEAACTISVERQNQYGSPEDSFELIAALWTPYIRRKLEDTGEVWLGTRDVAHMMALLKIARLAHTTKRDNYTDAIGYLAIAADRLG